MSAAIVGVGSTSYGRRLGRSVNDLVSEASRRALDDAGLEIGAIDAIVTESSYMPMVAPPDRVAFELGHPGSVLSLSAGIGGAGVVHALGVADMLIATGRCRHVLSYFGSDFGTAPGGPYAFPVGVEAKLGYEAKHGWFGQPLYFAAMAERYDVEFGLPQEALAAVALAARAHAAMTDDAVLRRPLSLEDYWREPQIVGRFRRADCSVINDGAAAFVVSESGAGAAPSSPHGGVDIVGVGYASEPGQSSESFWTQRPSFTTTPCKRSAALAFERAGLTPADVDIAQIYDCFTISTILQLEDAGFCRKGEGADFALSGAIALGGSLPTNTHGGLLSHSYTVGAHHIVEAVQQLRGMAGERQVHGARVAYVAGLGLPEHASALLARAA